MGDKDIIIRSAGPVSKHIYDNQIDRIIQLCLVNDIHVVHVIHVIHRIIQLCLVNDIHVIHVMTMQGSTRVPGVTREVVKLYGVCMNELKVCILPPLSPALITIWPFVCQIKYRSTLDTKDGGFPPSL